MKTGLPKSAMEMQLFHPKRSRCTPKSLLFVLVVAVQAISYGPGRGYAQGQAIDDYDEVVGRGSQSDLAYEQYAERLQQQLESLRKEHDEIFGKGDMDRDGLMSYEEFVALHREAEEGDESSRYEDAELEEGFADLDRDASQALSLDEWRRPFEEHTDSWLQIADTEAQQEAQIAHYKDVFVQMDHDGDGMLNEAELQHEMDNLREQQRRADGMGREGEWEEESVVELSGAGMMLMMDTDRNGKVTFEEYLLGGEQVVTL